MMTLLLASAGCSGGEHVLATVVRDAGPHDGPPDAAPKCVPETRTVSDMGLDVYFLLDRSEELRSEWFTVVSWFSDLRLINEFSGISVGLATTPVFEKPDPTCLDTCGPTNCSCWSRNCGCFVVYDRQGCVCVPGDEECSQNAYVTPTFEISRLRENQQQLQLTLLSAGQPDHGEAAFRPLLQGTFQYRDTWERDHPGRRITQVIITSSLYGTCDDSPSEIAKLLATSGKTTKTYVVGVNVRDDDMDDYHDVAEAGQTTSAVFEDIYQVRPGAPPLPNPLPGLLRRIRSTEGRCEYVLPSMGGDVDASKVNLAVGGQSPSPFVYVNNEQQCSSSTLGWYYEYDDEGRPTRILTCPSTCAAIHQGQSGNAEIQIGCPTLIAPDAGRPEP